MGRHVASIPQPPRRTRRHPASEATSRGRKRCPTPPPECEWRDSGRCGQGQGFVRSMGRSGGSGSGRESGAPWPRVPGPPRPGGGYQGSARSATASGCFRDGARLAPDEPGGPGATSAATSCGWASGSAAAVVAGPLRPLVPLPVATDVSVGGSLWWRRSAARRGSKVLSHTPPGYPDRDETPAGMAGVSSLPNAPASGVREQAYSRARGVAALAAHACLTLARRAPAQRRRRSGGPALGISLPRRRSTSRRRSAPGSSRAGCARVA